jgi:tRNA nucleotidyltransferase/poly(A) polymerase
MDVSAIINADLIKLREHFNAKGFDIRIVGGAVRDFISGTIPHDIDLCTDATPDEQLAIYTEFGIHNIPTGVQHGTYTAVMNGEGYEITTLRTESEHDGRHATMAYTRDWTEDASRRDLTINAMALTFEGELVDPFGGEADLKNHVVRFVGNAEERMTEDYLRILRYFRFLGRYSDEQTAKANVPGADLYKTVNGLSNISAERIWAEMKKIMAHPSASWVVPMMIFHSVFDVIEFPTSTAAFHELKLNGCTDPVLLTAGMMYVRDKEAVDRIAARLKMSTDERQILLDIGRFDHAPTIEELRNELMSNRHAAAQDGLNRSASKVLEFYTDGKTVGYFDSFVKPEFPVTGDDLVAVGIKPGPQMGAIMKQLKEVWMSKDCTPDKEALMQAVADMA